MRLRETPQTVYITSGGEETEICTTCIRSLNLSYRVIFSLLPDHLHDPAVQLIIVTEDGKTPEAVTLNRLRIEKSLFQLGSKVLIITTDPDTISDRIKKNRMVRIIKSPISYIDMQQEIRKLIPEW
jgi:hypothetical protein